MNHLSSTTVMAATRTRTRSPSPNRVVRCRLASSLLMFAAALSGCTPKTPKDACTVAGKCDMACTDALFKEGMCHPKGSTESIKPVCAPPAYKTADCVAECSQNGFDSGQCHSKGTTDLVPPAAAPASAASAASAAPP